MISKELLARIRKVEIRTRRMVDELTAGAYHSVFKGSGIEFDEVREYTPEDDASDIDWNVTARMGQAYVKKFVEERDLTLLLVVDLSGSQQFGSQYLLKRDLAAELAAVLAFSAVANHDRVGAVLFTDRVESFVAPARGNDHALRIVRDLLATRPAGTGTDLDRALRFARQILKRRSIVAVISDFQATGYERALGMLRRRHDVIALHLADPRESEVPDVGLVALRDPETGQVRVVDTSSRAVRQRLRTSSFDAAREVFRRTGVDTIPLSTAASYEQPLRAFFKARERRR